MRSWLDLLYVVREKAAEAARGAEEARRSASRTGGARRHPATIVLSRREVLRVTAPRGGLRVACLTGRIWATTDRAAADTVLLPGQAVEYGSRERVVIEALRTAAVRVQCGQPIRLSVGMTTRPALASL